MAMYVSKSSLKDTISEILAQYDLDENLAKNLTFDLVEALSEEMADVVEDDGDEYAADDEEFYDEESSAEADEE